METLGGGGGGGGGGCVNRGDGGMKNKRTGKDMERRRRRVERGEAKWEGNAIRGEETEEGTDSETQNKTA